MKLQAQNFHIAYGNKGKGLSVEPNDKFFSLDETTQINIIAGNCFDDWDDEDDQDFEAISETIKNFINNNHESQSISMWFE